MMKILFLLKWCIVFILLSSVQKVSAEGNLHFIVFADTDDSSIGTANLKTYTYLTSNLAPILLQHSGLKLIVSSFYGSKCNVSQLDQTINDLTVGSNDVVFFYFVGHGWNSRVNNYPSIIFGNANTDRATLELVSRNLLDVYDKIRTKKPRLTIVIGEACNKERSDEPPVTSSREVLIMKPSTVDPVRLAKIFNNWQGGIILSSSQRNEFSHSDPKGGWMGVAFQNAMSEMYSVSSKIEPSWNGLLENVKRKTVEMSRINQQEQTPQFEIDIRPFTITKISNPNPGKALPKSDPPCAPVNSYVNETALTGIREDLPLLTDMYEQINSNNATEYAEAFSLFYTNQKAFYDKLGQIVFYKVGDIPPHCRPSFETTNSWVGSNACEVSQRYAVIQKYSNQPNKLVQQARSDLPSIIRRLEEILEKLDK